MSALMVNFKIDDLQEMLNQIDAYVKVLKDENDEEREFISLDSLKGLIEENVHFEIIDEDKL